VKEGATIAPSFSFLSPFPAADGKFLKPSASQAGPIKNSWET
jgi:hypothetical protein